MIQVVKHIGLMTDKEILKLIGTRIKEERISKNLRQEDLSKKANITLRAVQRLEQTGEISFDKIISISRALGRLDIFQEFFSFEKDDDLLSYEEYVNKQQKKKTVRLSGKNKSEW